MLAWTRNAVESRGWRYEVWTEPPPVELANLRLLAGYRRGWLFAPDVLNELQDADVDGLTLDAVCRALPLREPEVVRAAALHLLWQRHFEVDLSQPLHPATVLRITS